MHRFFSFDTPFHPRKAQPGETGTCSCTETERRWCETGARQGALSFHHPLLAHPSPTRIAPNETCGCQTSRISYQHYQRNHNDSYPPRPPHTHTPNPTSTPQPASPPSPQSLFLINTHHSPGTSLYRHPRKPTFFYFSEHALIFQTGFVRTWIGRLLGVPHPPPLTPTPEPAVNNTTNSLVLVII